MLLGEEARAVGCRIARRNTELVGESHGFGVIGAEFRPRVPALVMLAFSGVRCRRSRCSASGERQMLPVQTVRTSNNGSPLGR